MIFTDCKIDGAYKGAFIGPIDIPMADEKTPGTGLGVAGAAVALRP
jgi:hypothetical protein